MSEDNKKNKKIPGYVRKDIRQRAKKEAGLTGGKVTKKSKAPTKAGTFLRKVTTGSKYGLKKQGGGADLGKPTKPVYKRKKADVAESRFLSTKDGQLVEDKSKRSKGSSTSAAGLEAKNQAKSKLDKRNWSAKERSDAEKFPEYKENKEAAKKAKYVKGKQTKDQEAYDQSVEDRRRTYKRAGLSKRKNKRDLKREYKKQYRKGTYEPNR